MPHRHMKKSSSLLSENYKINSQYDFTRKGENFKSPNVEEDVEKLELSCTLSGSINW